MNTQEYDNLNNQSSKPHIHPLHMVRFWEPEFGRFVMEEIVTFF